jgi:hypothetical protein
VKPLIVGDRTDRHVQAVLDALQVRGAIDPVVLDAPLLQQRGFFVDLDHVRHGAADLPVNETGRGWLRRYAPSAWGAGAIAGSLESVTKGAFLSLVGSISRVGKRDWLTPLDKLLAAEDRLYQLERARELGFFVPRTVVTSNPQEAVEMLGPHFVVKPLATGYFLNNGMEQAVFTTELTADEAVGLDFGAAPFVAQQRLHVREHLRIVTVRGDAWASKLSGDDRPIDWRQQESAHGEWTPCSDNETCEGALALAATLGAGYSSQDWVRCDEGVAFLDLNPGGQWLFLPSAVAAAVTRAIAGYLADGSE